MSVRKRTLLTGAALLAGLCLGTGAALAGGGGTPAGEMNLGAEYVVGPAKAVDKLNGTVVVVPKGWYAIVPTQGLEGATTLANYDLEQIESSMPEHSSHVLLEEMVKVDVTTRPLEGRSLEEMAELLSQPDPNLPTPGFKTSVTVPVRIAGRDGFAYSVAGRGNALVFTLPATADKALVATVRPADSLHLEAALRVLDRARLKGEMIETKAKRPALTALAKQLRSLELETPATLKNIPVKSCAAWSGSDSGWYAGNTPITINLPFLWGTTWQAGGAGNFWGNWTHGNCFNDYYAIDFNRMNSSCSGYLSDSGQNVYSASGGTAYDYYDANGYGYYVDVYHSSNVRTRYAHLSSDNVFWGQSVTNQSVVGWVGSTGNSGGPHLHFGFYKDGYSRCYKSGGCPNGEGASWPQSPKPSPMWTNSGSLTISDYSCYTAPP